MTARARVTQPAALSTASPDIGWLDVPALADESTWLLSNKVEELEHARNETEEAERDLLEKRSHETTVAAGVKETISVARQGAEAAIAWAKAWRALLRGCLSKLKSHGLTLDDLAGPLVDSERLRPGAADEAIAPLAAALNAKREADVGEELSRWSTAWEEEFTPNDVRDLQAWLAFLVAELRKRGLL